jgi:hypothetical protein
MKWNGKIGRGLTFFAIICLCCACQTTPEPVVAEPAEIVEVEPEPEPVIVEPAVQVAPAPEPEPSPEPFVHTVRWKGETLTHISRWYTGSTGNWKAIAAANPGINPDRIFPGNEIVIPDELLENRTPMPQDVVPPMPKTGAPDTAPARVAAPDAPEPVSAAPPAPEPAIASEPDERQADIELYGPVEQPDDIELYGPVEVK